MTQDEFVVLLINSMGYDMALMFLELNATVYAEIAEKYDGDMGTSDKLFDEARMFYDMSKFGQLLNSERN